MKEILVTGSTGMLGESIVNNLLKNNGFKLYGLSRTNTALLPTSHQIQLDLSEGSFESLLKDWLTPDVIIHTAAYVNLSFCEEHPDKANGLHVAASAKLAALYPEALFIYISTDSIFEGEKGNYTEFDIPAPLNHYARTKYLGELEVQKSTSNAVVIRTNIYGKRSGKSGGLAEWAISNLTKKISINGFDDVIFNPLYTGQVANFLELFILNEYDFRGIINLGCEEFVSKYAFIKMLAKTFRLDQELIQKDKMRGKPSDLQRPFNTSLNVSKCKALFNKSFRLLDGVTDLKNNYE
jgi:dTDP-4-dehydrorhamnose reductase